MQTRAIFLVVLLAVVSCPLATNPAIAQTATNVSILQDASSDAKAKVELGLAYITGSTGEQNYRKAAEILHAAADLGSPDGKFALAYLFEHGKGVPTDYGQA